MATKSISKLQKMVPREIRAIIMDRPILASESQEEYDNLLMLFAEKWKPKDVLHWFEVKRACVLAWEEQRMHRIKAAILDTAYVVEDARTKEKMLTNQYLDMAREHPGKFDKKSIKKAIQDAREPARTIGAKAFVERMHAMETMEKLQCSNEARQRFVYETLAERQTIQLLPVKANDNEEDPARLASPCQSEYENGRRDEANRDPVQEPDEEGSAGEAEASQQQVAIEPVPVDVEPGGAGIDHENYEASEEEAA